jgi:UDP-N-acetyl-D-galactosamine dehydrogenase
MRNTRVVDIIEELKTYGCNVDAYDPWVDPKEEKSKYKHGIIDIPFKNSKKYDSIVVAVAHKQFKELTETDYINISNGKPIIIDIKGIVKNPNWRL